MESEKRIVVVAGATGRTGRLVVEELVNRGFHVRAMVRSASSASWLQQERVEIVEGDISSVASMEKIMEGAPFVISALGSKKPFSRRENNKVDNMGNQNLAKAAKAKGVQRLVVISSIGAGDSRNTMNFFSRLVLGPVLKMKEKSEEFIKGYGLNYTIIRPGGLKDKELTGEIAFGEGGKIVGSVSRKQIAKVCVDALSNSSMQNRTFEIVDASTVKEELRPYILSQPL